VRVLLWTHWRELRDPRRRARLLDRWAGWGVAGIKADFLQSDRPRRIAVYDAIARAAARRRLLVNFHGCTLPRGIQRTWPNVLTMEAVLGAEHAVTAAHDVDLVFTRNAVGSMDYTPALTALGSTAGHQLALAVAFESGLQHLADRPATYAANPAADAVLRALPAAWDDTRLLDGAPDSHAVVARRSGAEWWVAGIHAGAATTRTVALGFLPPGRSYRATVTADDLTAREATVTAADRLTVPVAADGGFTIRLAPV
jgi:alpha-glucosidase